MLGEPEGVGRTIELMRKGAAGAPVSGHIMFAALTSLEPPADPMEALWFAADVIREHRGDSHANAWLVSGLVGLEISILTNLWMSRPLDRLARMSMVEQSEIDACLADLERRGLVQGETLTEQGEAFRGEIEADTDRQEEPILNALSDAELEELFTLLEPWGKQIYEAGGLMSDPSASVRP
jgi:DNA-binding MarR family transcriptional regulator